MTLPIKPDGLFVVNDLHAEETLALFTEAERLTAPNKRSTFKQSCLYKKVLAFLHYYQRLDQLCERLDIPIDDFIVPVVCENPERKELPRKRLYELGPSEQESSIFWVSDRTSLDLTQPQFLYGEVWTTAAGEQGSIFADPGVLSPSVKKTSLRHVHVNSASKALASFKSAVSKPSVNQL